MKILILDDDLNRHGFFNNALRHEDVTNVYTSKECIEELKKEDWDIVFLDHDLGGQVYVESGEYTGYEVALFLEQNPEYKPPKVIIHSLNPQGARNMQMAISGSKHIPIIVLQNDIYGFINRY